MQELATKAAPYIFKAASSALKSDPKKVRALDGKLTERGFDIARETTITTVSAMLREEDESMKMYQAIEKATKIVDELGKVR